MLRGLPMTGSTPAIKTLSSFLTVTKGAVVPQSNLFFNETGSLKHSEKLPADGREFAVVGINAHTNLQFGAAGATAAEREQLRYAFERVARFRMEVGEETVIDCLLADLLNYDSIPQLDGTIHREVRQMGGLRLDQEQSRVIRPNLRTVIELSVPTEFTTFDSGVTVQAGNIVAANQYFLQLNLDTDANAA